MLNFEPSRAGYLNSCCACQTLDEQALSEHLSRLNGAETLSDLKQTHPHLFAHERVFVSRHDLNLIAQTVRTIDAISQMPTYIEATLTGDARLTTENPKTRSVFNSYDFHLTADGPALIEINTNAGGAFLASASGAAHDECCTLQAVLDRPLADDFAGRIAAMFQSEWRLAGHTGPLKTIAIVDDDPEGQFLYPDFVLAKAVLQDLGFEVFIADAATLKFGAGRLMLDDQAIDLVYNRVTDFRLEDQQHAALRAAVETSAVVVTPHPYHHAVLADKRNLVRLTDPAFWDKLALSAGDRAVLARVPRAEIVSENNAERLWVDRKNQFFKPFSGHAGKGVYRGDKLTSTAWAHILDGGYIAQSRVNPSERRVLAGDAEIMLKADIRAFTYGAEILLVAARLYQGQVTNMRTLAGGLAPVSLG